MVFEHPLIDDLRVLELLAVTECIAGLRKPIAHSEKFTIAVLAR